MLHYSVIFNGSSVPLLSAMSASGSGVLFRLFRGSAFSIKRRELRLGTTSFSPSLSLSEFLSLTEVRLFILPQTVAVLGVDVKMPGACGAKGMRACVYVRVCVCVCP